MPTLFSHDRGVIARYRSHLPVSDQTPVISLNEGSTPLIHCPKLSARVGNGCEVYVKFEGLNPTGSFKDRGMTMAMSKAAEEGAQIVICASTGNTSAAAAAYAARANLKCVVLLPAGKISLGKLAQSLVYGAKVIAIDGNFDAALRLVVELGQRPGIAVVNSINPYRIEGQKTAAFEIIDELGAAPDLHILPVGNAGNITAYWKGYHEYQALGKSATLPAMFGLQAAGSAPVYHDQVVKEPDTLATAIRIGHPASWDGARAALRDSRGAIDIVTDAEILAAQQWLAASEGVFVEPASAASIAGLLKCYGPAAETGFSPSGFPTRPPIKPGSVIVCTVTGNGLKDPDAVMNTAFQPILATADVDDVLRKSGL